MSTFIFTDGEGNVEEVQTTTGTLEGIQSDLAGSERQVYQAPPDLMDAQVHALPGNSKVSGGYLEVFSLRAIRERLAAIELEGLEADEYHTAQALQTIEYIRGKRDGNLAPNLREHYEHSAREFDAIENKRSQLMATAPEAPEVLRSLAGRRFHLGGV